MVALSGSGRRRHEARLRPLAAQQEGIALADKRFTLDSRIAGIEASGRTEADKRLRVARLELAATTDQLKTRSYANDEERRALQIQELRQETGVKLAKAELDVERSQYGLAQRTAATQGQNFSATAKQYRVLLTTNTALKEQLAALKDINGAKSQGLGLDLKNNENAVREFRQSQLYGKSGSQIQEELRRNRTEKIKRDKFDRITDRNDGLIRVDKDMNGNITGGIDAITGEYRTPRAGKGRAESGLRSGSLTDPAMGTDGSPSRIIDRDAGGGLHSGSGGSSLFEARSRANGIRTQIFNDRPSGTGNLFEDRSRANGIRTNIFSDAKERAARGSSTAGTAMQQIAKNHFVEAQRQTFILSTLPDKLAAMLAYA